jgi:RNA ligase
VHYYSEYANIVRNDDSHSNEGVVITFINGHRLKIKTEWYCQIHRAKENLLHEKRVIGMIVEEKLDDILPFLLEDDKKSLLDYQSKFLEGMRYIINDLKELWLEAKTMDRKSFALSLAKTINPLFASVIFDTWDKGRDNIQESVLKIIKKNLGSQNGVDKVRVFWGNTVKWNYGVIEDE